MPVIQSQAQAISASERRTAPYTDEPGFYEPAKLWLYGNVKLLHTNLAYIADSCGLPIDSPGNLNKIEAQAEQLVLDGRILVCGVHNDAHQRAAIVPLRWGSPRIVVFSGGFYHHLGDQLSEEPFRAARLWRYQWDPKTDLAVSRRAPDRLPTYALYNPTVDKLIRQLATGSMPGLSSPIDSLTAIPIRSN